MQPCISLDLQQPLLPSLIRDEGRGVDLEAAVGYEPHATSIEGCDRSCTGALADVHCMFTVKVTVSMMALLSNFLSFHLTRAHPLSKEDIIDRWQH